MAISKKNKNKRGFTLGEMMIATAIVAVLVSLAVFGLRALMSGDSVAEDAKAEVRDHTRNLGITIDKTPEGKDAISCGNITTKKGLVGCTFKSNGVTHQLECIGRYSPGHGCRDQKLSVPSEVEQP